MEWTRENIRSLMVGALMCVLLFCSGPLVIFTPLPILYVSMHRRKEIGLFAGGLALLVMLAIYWVIFPMASTDTAASYFLLIPGWNLAKDFDIRNIQIFGTLYFVYFALFGVALSEGMSRKWAMMKSVASTVGITLGVSAGIIVILNILGIVNIIEALDSYIHVVIAEIIEVNQEAGGMEAEFFAMNADKLAAFTLRIVPASLFIFTTFIALSNLLIGGRLSKKKTLMLTFSRQFVKWSVPDWMIWCLIGSGGLFFVNHYVIHSGVFRVIAMNAAIVSLGIYLLQGLAIMAFHMQRWRSRFVKIVVFVMLVMFVQMSAMGLILLGIADYWLAFRKLRKINPNLIQ